MTRLGLPSGLQHQLWVDERTYLPLRSVLRYPFGPAGNLEYGTIQSDHELLRPTPANPSQLQPIIPAGFRQTAGPPPHPGG